MADSSTNSYDAERQTGIKTEQTSVAVEELEKPSARSVHGFAVWLNRTCQSMQLILNSGSWSSLVFYRVCSHIPWMAR
jgi:hypothetical protein